MKRFNCFMGILLMFVAFSCSSQVTTNNNNQSTVSKKKPHPENPYYSRTDTTSLRKVSLSKWEEVLSPEVYNTAFKKGTDRRFQGYWDAKGKGTYYCGVCGNKLFQSTAKFASTCGWPSFFIPAKNAVEYHNDNSHGMHRIEVICLRCWAHLGHVFKDGPPPTGVRYCMNSSVLDFVEDSTLTKTPKNGITLNYKKITNTVR